MKDVKSFNVRLPRDIWAFLKKESCEKETSMTNIIADCLDKYKQKCEKKLTSNDALV